MTHFEKGTNCDRGESYDITYSECVFSISTVFGTLRFLMTVWMFVPSSSSSSSSSFYLFMYKYNQAWHSIQIMNRTSKALQYLRSYTVSFVETLWRSQELCVGGRHECRSACAECGGVWRGVCPPQPTRGSGVESWSPPVRSGTKATERFS